MRRGVDDIGAGVYKYGVSIMGISIVKYTSSYSSTIKKKLLINLFDNNKCCIIMNNSQKR